MVAALVAGLVCITLVVLLWCLLSKDARDVARYVLIAVFRIFN